MFKDILLSILISLLILLFPLIFFLNSTSYFKYRFDHYDIYKNFNQEDKKVVDDQFHEVIKYINFRTGTLDEAFFSFEDMMHLKDVKNIVRVYYLFFFTGVIFTIILLIKKKIDQKIIPKILVVNIIIILVLFISVIFNFTNVFIKFHEILFNNDYWMLNPESSNLIKYFPEEVFREIGELIVVFDIIVTLLLLLTWILKTKKFSSVEVT